MNIIEFRKKYPDYNDINDIDLTKKLHQQFYSDLSLGEFSAKFNPKQPTIAATPSEYKLPPELQTPTYASLFPKPLQKPVGKALAFGTALSSGVNRSAASMVDTVGKITDLTVDYLNYGAGLKPTEKQPTPRISKPQIFRKVADELIKNADYWDEQTQNVGEADALTEIIGKVSGSLPAGVAEWMANVPYATLAAAGEAHEQGKPVTWEAVKGGTKRYLLGKALQGISKIRNPVIRRGLGAATLGGAAAYEGGTPTDIATQSVMGALLSPYGGRKPTTKMPENLRMLKSVEKMPEGYKKYTFATPEYAKLQAETAKVELTKAGYAADIKVEGNAVTIKPLGKQAAKPAQITPAQPAVSEKAVTPAVTTPETIVGQPEAKQAKAKAETEQYWISSGYTKPTAKSMAVLGDVIEYTEGRPTTGGLYPWQVRLTKEATQKLKPEMQYNAVKAGSMVLGVKPESFEKLKQQGYKIEESPVEQIIITKPSELHKIAQQWESLKLQPSPPSAEAGKQARKGLRKGFVYVPSEEAGKLAEAAGKKLTEAEPTMGVGGASEIKSIITEKGEIAPDFIADVKTSLKAATKVRPKILKEQKATRAQRFGSYGKAVEQEYKQTGVAEQSILGKPMGALKGEQAQYAQRYESLDSKYTPEQKDVFFKKIIKNPALSSIDRLNVAKSFKRFWEGYYLRLSDVRAIASQFPELSKEAFARLPLGDKGFSYLEEVGGLMKAMPAGGEMSGIGRQMRLVAHHPILYAKTIGKYHKAYWSTAETAKINEEIKSHPDFKESVEFGISYAKGGQGGIEPFAREEKFPTKYAEKIPLMKQSERSFVASQNWLRLALYSNFKAMLGEKGNPVRLKRLASYVNDLTSRSDISKTKGMKGLSNFLNIVSFAPRYYISRYKIPFKMLSRDPIIRQDAAKAMATFIGTNVIALKLAELAGADVEWNPLSSDAYKIKVGNTRFDLWTGYAQIVRFLSQMATGKVKTAAGHIIEKPRKDILLQHLQTKESPFMGLLGEIVTGKEIFGNKAFQPPQLISEPKTKAAELHNKFINWMNDVGVPKTLQIVGKEAYQHLGYFFIRDTVDALINDGTATALAALGTTWYGVSTQSYPESPYTTTTKLKDQLAQKEHGKNWEDLGVVAQNRLRRQNKKIAELERTAKYEYSQKAEGKYEGENKVLQLTPQINSIFRRLEIPTPAVSRKIKENWILNDERYARYATLATEEINTRLNIHLQSGTWEGRTDDQKRRIIEHIIETSKEKARNKITREGNRRF